MKTLDFVQHMLRQRLAEDSQPYPQRIFTIRK